MVRKRWATAAFDAMGRPGWVAACAASGLALRLVLIATGTTMRFYDEHDYHALATALLDGQGFALNGLPTAFRAPGQPLFMAAVYAVLGRRPVAVEVVQALLLIPLPFLVVRLARLISGQGDETGAETAPQRPATLLAALVALHPGLAYAAASLYPVSLTALALTTGVWLVAQAVASGSVRRAAAGAVMLGIAGACVTYLAPLAAAAALIAAARRRFAVALTVLVVGTAPAAAWTARNAVTLGTPQLSTNGGYNLALGANDRATPRSGNWVEPDVGPLPLPAGEVDRDRAYRAVAMAWIRERPLRYASLAAGRALAALDSVGRPRTAGVHASGAAAAAGWLLAPMVALGLVGLFQRRREVAAWLTLAALALIMAGSAVTIAKPRFRFPCDPLLWAFAAVAAEGLVERRRAVARPAAARLAPPVR